MTSHELRFAVRSLGQAVLVPGEPAPAQEQPEPAQIGGGSAAGRGPRRLAPRRPVRVRFELNQTVFFYLGGRLIDPAPYLAAASSSSSSSSGSGGSSSSSSSPPPAAVTTTTSPTLGSGGGTKPDDALV